MPISKARAASNMMIERYNQSGTLNAVRDVAVNGTRLQMLNDEPETQADRLSNALHPARCRGRHQRGLTSRLQATEARCQYLPKRCHY